MKIVNQHIQPPCRKPLCLFIGLMLLAAGAFAQQKTVVVTGIVADQSGEGLPGATVLENGTNNGTVTGVGGEFTLNVPEGKEMVVSFVSFETQRMVITSALPMPIKITLLQNVVSLNETVVVAVGYGTMRKSDLTGAIASVPADKLRQGVVTSTEQVLQGRIAGLSVIQGSGDPSAGSSLRLRGGTSLSASNSPLIVVDGIPGVDINAVNPSDIVSIDVLKDASSAAIYGSRGANGVIIVTTNRQGKGKNITYNGYVGVSQVANHLDLLSANQWRKYVRDNHVQNATDFGGDTDWQKELEQTGISQSHVLSFSNSNEDGGFRASVNYLDNEGIIERSYLTRLGGSVSGYQYGLNDRLKVEAGVNASSDKWLPVDYRIFERSYNLNPTIPVRDANGMFTQVGGTLYENPVELNTNRSVENTRQRILGYGKAELEIIEGLKATTNVSFEYNSLKENEYKPSYAMMEGQTDKGYGRKALGEYANSQIESFLSYDDEFGAHRMNLMGGYSFLENVYEGFGALRRGFDTDLFTYNNLGAGQDYRQGDVYSYKGKTRLVSFFGRANYSYDGRYMATFTLRQDGSSRFGKNNKWGLFPSASLAWRISDEGFMQSTSEWLNNLKLRLGYGVTGNQDAISAYASLPIYGAGSLTYYDAATNTWKQAYGPTQNPNENLKWESTAQFNIGLDFSLFNRLNGVIEVYRKNTKDLLYTYSVPADKYIYAKMLANVGELSNKGIELTLNANIIEKKDFTFGADLTLSSNKMVVEKLSNDEFQTDVVKLGNLQNLTGLTGVYSQVLKEGEAVGTFWGKKTGKIVDGVLEIDDEPTVLGNAQPKFNVGFNMNFTWKKFDASVATYGMFGQKVLNATAMVLNSDTRLPAYNVPDDYFGKPQVPTNEVTDYWIEDASFMRLQSVTVGYSLPLSKNWFQKARIYVTGENLMILTGYSGIDPEVSIDGLDHPGIDMFNYYPKPRTFTMGINLTF
ncbi:MAG: TonB-dependent receptor [Breznakibacter sp.]